MQERDEMNNEQIRRNSGGNSFPVFWLPDSVYNHHQEGSAMAIPKYDKLMKLFLHTLADGWVHKLKDITAKLADEFHLTQDEPEEVLSGGAENVFRNGVGRARTYLR